MSTTNTQAGNLQVPPVVTARIGIYLLGLLLLVSFIMGVVEGAAKFLSIPADPSTAGLKPLGAMLLFIGSSLRTMAGSTRTAISP